MLTLTAATGDDTESMNGILVVDKPSGMTSHDVVNRVRRILQEKSVGHLGTLDPMATGVLPLVLGRMTRIAQFYGSSAKAYEGEIRFGFATDTYDADGTTIEVSGSRPVTELTLTEIEAAATKFQGVIDQTPPSYSAKKIDGVRAYKLARKSQEVELKTVQVIVEVFKIFGFDGERSSFESKVSSGTYIRSLAHDLGQALGTGAHLTALRRTQVSEFTLEDAHSLEEIEAFASDPSSLFVHPRRALTGMPSVTATDQAASYLRNGRAVNLPEMSSAPLVKVFVGQSELLAICQRVAGTLFRPKVVLWGTEG